MIVNIALLTVTDTRTIDNDKSGAILVDKIAQANHKLIERKICKDNKDDIVSILKDWTTNKDIDVVITTFKPPIFWKDKDTVKQQAINYSTKNTELLIRDINKTELQIKKNYNNSINILLDFMLQESKQINSKI